MRRLYLQIYAAFLGIAALCVLVAGLSASLLMGDRPEVPAPARGAAAWVMDTLPPPEDPAFPAALREASERLSLDLTLWDASGALIGASDQPAPASVGRCEDEGWFHGEGAHGYRIRLDDGRCVAATADLARVRNLRHFAGLLLFPLLFAVVAAGCYPLARRVTRRVELLQRSMTRLGQGELDARAEVQGADELAELARSFNLTAERIQALVLSQRRVLASASHELRSPLARLQLALELLAPEEGDADRAEVHAEAIRDVGELDQLIGDVLLGARLEARALTPRREPVALEPLLRAEAERVGANLSGPADTVQADPTLLRSLVRNLLENARRHGGGEVELWLEPGPDRVVLVVADRGPGVPEELRDRIFEPFYRAPGHRESSGGVGLGLALVRWIAEAHGGTARNLPRDGGGSRFEVSLPRA